jgi:hypothetical protein
MSKIRSKLVSVFMAVTIVLSLGTVGAYAQSTTDESLYNVPATINYIPLIGETAAAVATVTTTTSNPYVSVTVGSLASGMTSVNIRIHDNEYNYDTGTDISHDELQMYLNGNMEVAFTNDKYMIAGHTYTVYMSANGSGGTINVNCSAVAG